MVRLPSMADRRIGTFIRGFDEQMSGGVPAGHIVLLAGKPGAMKSSVAFNIMYHNAKQNGKGGLYVTLEQTRESLLASMAQLGMNAEGLGNKISVLDLGLIRKKLQQLGNKSWVEVFKMYVQNLDSTLDLDLLVVDSLPVLEVLAKFTEPRDDLFRLFEWLRELGVTTLLISEMEQGSDKFCANSEDFLADGIIHLDIRRDDRHVGLYIGIAKMRRTAHSREYFPLIFDPNGFEIVAE